jgi:hypothetical protein
MVQAEPCHICGTCWWVDCDNDADYSIDVDVAKRHGDPVFYSGKVDLCGGHFRVARDKGGRLNLNWLAVEQALAARN